LSAKHQHDDDDSEYIEKTSCDFCGSRDNRAVYSDGHSFCFTCPEETAWQPPAGEEKTAPKVPPKPKAGLLRGEVQPIKARGLDAKTVEKFRYLVGTYHGKPVQIAQYADRSGRIVAQKWRDKDKNMEWVGDQKDALPLFGQHLWRHQGRMVVVTEGEIDAMSVAQAMGLTWPAVSIPNGAQSAAKAISKAIDWLEGFDKVVLMFDMDEPGREAVKEVARLLKPGKAFIATLPLKDANEMVVAGRSDELVRAAWDARVYRPDGIIRIHDHIDEALSPPSYGYPWPWRGPTEATYGIRRGELYGWGAGVGVGKTTAFKQLIASTAVPRLIADHTGLDVLEPGEPRRAGTLLLEENARRKTIKTLGGMVLGKRVHVPGVEFDPAELRRILEEELDPWLFLYDSFGAKDWDGVKNVILHMVLGDGITDVFLDNLTAMLAFADDDRKELDRIMAEMASMVERYNFTLHYVSHLTTPDGKAHEEGGRVLEKQFTGGRAIARWSHNLVALERDKQKPDAPTTLRILKDRETGDATGKTFGLAYDRDTGLFEEVDHLSDGPFTDETKGSDEDF
jgi:twinkle protein